MRIGPAAHIKMLPDRNVWFQGSSGLRQGATRKTILATTGIGMEKC